jgi:branched-chain amino acid transport system ATP-binding protein
MDNTLVLKNVDAFYGATQVLFGLNLTLEPGAITTLLGANGAGKTTTLRAIGQSIRTRGDILLGDIDLTSLRTEQIARCGLAHVPSGRGTFAALSVEENLWLGAYPRKDREEIRVDIEQAYERFPRLKERRLQQAGTLSGGEQQMLAISRALMLRPKVLLLDEPSFGLAPLVVDSIMRSVSDLVERESVSVLLVEQNANIALGISKFAYVLESGSIVMSGSSELIGKDDKIRNIYLGL